METVTLKYDLRLEASQFEIPGTFVAAESCGSGHNETYRVTVDQAACASAIPSNELTTTWRITETLPERKEPFKQ
jgi:hypothetical protein